MSSNPPNQHAVPPRRSAAPTGVALREAVRCLVLAHGMLDDTERPCGAPLSAPHAYALIELLHDGPMTATELAQRLSIDRSNVSRLCARMETLGELVGVVHPEDRRARLLRLTVRGRRAARAVDASSIAHFDRVLASLGPNPHQVVEALFELANAMHTTSRSSDQTPPT